MLRPKSKQQPTFEDPLPSHYELGGTDSYEEPEYDDCDFCANPCGIIVYILISIIVTLITSLAITSIAEQVVLQGVNQQLLVMEFYGNCSVGVIKGGTPTQLLPLFSRVVCLMGACSSVIGIGFFVARIRDRQCRHCLSRSCCFWRAKHRAMEPRYSTNYDDHEDLKRTPSDPPRDDPVNMDPIDP
jgi:hypothetical protein